MRNIFQTDSNNKLIMPTFVLCHAYQEPIDTLSYVEDFDMEFIENDERAVAYRGLDWSYEYDLAINGDPTDTQSAL